MATGTSTYNGLAVPLTGEAQITQVTAATDILTITGAASQSGDFIVLENSTGTELVVTGNYLVSALATTVPIQAIKVLLGDSPWYIPLLTSTCLAAS